MSGVRQWTRSRPQLRMLDARLKPMDAPLMLS
jgi:hypothetical protein